MNDGIAYNATLTKKIKQNTLSPRLYGIYRYIWNRLFVMTDKCMVTTQYYLLVRNTKYAVAN